MRHIILSDADTSLHVCNTYDMSNSVCNTTYVHTLVRGCASVDLSVQTYLYTCLHEPGCATHMTYQIVYATRVTYVHTLVREDTCRDMSVKTSQQILINTCLPVSHVLHTRHSVSYVLHTCNDVLTSFDLF